MISVCDSIVGFDHFDASTQCGEAPYSVQRKFSQRLGTERRNGFRMISLKVVRFSHSSAFRIRHLRIVAHPFLQVEDRSIHSFLYFLAWSQPLSQAQSSTLSSSPRHRLVEMQETNFLSVLLVILASFSSASARYGVNRPAVVQPGGDGGINTHYGHGPAGPITTTATPAAPAPTSFVAPAPTHSVAPAATHSVAPAASSSVAPAPVGSATATTVAPPSPSSSSSTPVSGGWCINFTTAPGTPAWYWTNANPWSGSGDASTASQCFAPNDGAGGAMFIGSSANPSAGNTKLECFFPTAGQGNCDVSLVDGYSLSVQCTLPGAATIGLNSTQNLWNNNDPCPGTVQDGFCKNPNGYTAAITDVGAFFQPAIDTCYIWQYDGLDPTFDGPSTIDCTVSGSAPPSSYTKRDDNEVEKVALDALESRNMDIARSHTRKRRAHARALGQLMGVAKI